MSAHASFAHFSTFARLRRAGEADLPQLRALSERACGEGKHTALDWPELLQGEGAYVLVATECHLVVGVGILAHGYSAAEASLPFLLVSPDVRCRGIGHLLLETLVGRARSEGGAVLYAAVPERADGLARLYAEHGFFDLGSGEWAFGLWNGHQSRSYSDIAVPWHDPVAPEESAAQCLLVAMGALEPAMLLTPRARQVVAQELNSEGADLPVAHAMALAAARRRYVVRIGFQATGALPAPDLADRLIEEPMPGTPEMILGYLARRQICIMRLHLPRLAAETEPRWYLVTGFDGFLFRLHDVTGDSLANRRNVVTAAEMRLALQDCEPDDALILSRVA